MAGSAKVQAALTPGRFVLWANPVSGLTEPAVLLGDTPDACRMHPPASSAAAGAGVGGRVAGASAAPGGKRFALLVLHSPSSVDGRHLQELQRQRAAAGPAAGAAGGVAQVAAPAAQPQPAGAR